MDPLFSSNDWIFNYLKTKAYILALNSRAAKITVKIIIVKIHTSTRCYFSA